MIKKKVINEFDISSIIRDTEARVSDALNNIRGDFRNRNRPSLPAPTTQNLPAPTAHPGLPAPTNNVVPNPPTESPNTPPRQIPLNTQPTPRPNVGGLASRAASAIGTVGRLALGTVGGVVAGVVGNSSAANQNEPRLSADELSRNYGQFNDDNPTNIPRNKTSSGPIFDLPSRLKTPSGIVLEPRNTTPSEPRIEPQIDTRIEPQVAPQIDAPTQVQPQVQPAAQASTQGAVNNGNKVDVPNRTVLPTPVPDRQRRPAVILPNRSTTSTVSDADRLNAISLAHARQTTGSEAGNRSFAGRSNTPSQDAAMAQASVYDRGSNGNYYQQAARNMQNRRRENAGGKLNPMQESVFHEKWGDGEIIATMNKLDESGNIISYDVMFKHGIEKDVPTSELVIEKKKQKQQKIPKNPQIEWNPPIADLKGTGV